jgi:hypothetical protein
MYTYLSISDDKHRLLNAYVSVYSISSNKPSSNPAFYSSYSYRVKIRISQRSELIKSDVRGYRTMVLKLCSAVPKVIVMQLYVKR